jgi:hypothetical protein
MNLSGGAYTLLWSVVAAGMTSPGSGTPWRIAPNAIPHAESLSATMATAAGLSSVVESRQTAASASASMAFDIDAQPLDTALEAYGAATGQSIIYDGKLTEGKVSRPVKGAYTRRAALDLLLQDTGLMVRYTDEDALILFRAPAGGDRMAGRPEALQRYRGLVQAQVEEVFCSDAGLASGQRRVAFRFWIDRSGKIERAELLDTTGEPSFDKRVVDRLLRTSIAEAPPIGLAQPFTMLIMPRSSGHPWHCSGPAAGYSEYPLP